ncbi:titin-like isoform X2 [Anthonomus grandis grandis]|uniref:titin-like isoform X2 n=1 Tax=Anthonomus grandis grandis TaxID=2921223 RepID=UPI0021654B06|nr:titin-like isoform X2 [Anthonomus grandis grandis]
MFFHPVLLHIQHKSQLGLAWKAATMGIKKVKSSEVRACKITEMCNFIMEFLTSNSRDPKKRMSLRLTIMLVNGTVLIWRQQLVLLEGDIMNAIYTRERAVDRQYALLHEDDDDSTPKPKEKKKKPKKTKTSETPEFMAEEKKKRAQEKAEAEFLLEPLKLPEILEENVIQARVDEITLREDVPLQQKLMDDFGDEFMLQPEIERMAVQSMHQITVQADIHVPPRDKTMEVEFAVPAIEIGVPAEIPPPAQPMEEIVMDIQPLMRIEEPVVAPAVIEEEPPIVKEIKTAAQKIAQEEEQPLEATKAPELPQIQPVKTAKLLSDILRIKHTKKKSVYIDKALELCPEDDFSEAISQFILPPFRPMEKFWPDLEYEHAPLAREKEGEMHIPRRTGTKGSSLLSSLRRDTTSTGSVLTERSSSIQKVIISPLKRPIERDETHIVELPPAANQHVVESPLKHKITTVDEAKKRREKEPEQEIPMEQEIIIPVSTEDIKFGDKWSNEVLKIIRKQEKVTPEQICKSLGKRLIKRNMAVLFATLLALAKERLVCLLAAPNSIELEYVQPNHVVSV